jgi:hypothetical protein
LGAANAGLGSLSVNDLVIDPTSPSTLYVSCFDGLFKSIDGGGNWTLINSSHWFNLVIDPDEPDSLMPKAGMAFSAPRMAALPGTGPAQML